MSFQSEMTMVDRISTSPDEVLCHILSFLPTQNAIATTLLSKRWKSLWRSVPTLNFDDITYLKNDKPYSRIRDFIYRTILLHHQPIKGFRLKCQASRCDLSDADVNAWINAALQRGTENLELNLPYKLNLRFFIFSCKTLVVLKLRGLHVDVSLSSSYEFPSLKTLHLNEVHFVEPRRFKKLLCGCPNLEDFEPNVTYYQTYYDGGEFTSCFPKLVRAILFETCLKIPLGAVCNAEFLLIFEYAKETCDIPIFPNLTHLELIFASDFNWHFIHAMLKQCPKLQNLVLEKMISYLHEVVVWADPHSIPECLSSQLRKCFIINYDGTKCELVFAKYIMQNSKALRTMTISSAGSRDKLEMLKELSLCPRSSATCELSFK